MRLLGVLRLSRVTEASVSIDKQREIINAYALAHGHEIVAWAEDPGVSGDTSPFERQSLGPWLQPDRCQEFDGLVAWKVDRISRRLAHFAHLLDWADTNGKVVVAVSDAIDTSTKIGKMVAQILSMFAEFELDSIKERIKGTKAHLRTTNRFHGGPVPYGYQTQPIDLDNPKAGTCLAPDPETAAVVGDMVAAILGGQSVGALARDLNDRGVLAPVASAQAKAGKALTVNGRWETSTAQKILRSRSLLGQRTHKGTVVRGQDGLPLVRAEPLISQDQYDRLQVALDQASRPNVFRNAKALLSDVLVCGGCERPVVRQVQHRGDSTYAYYRCGSRTRGRACQRPVGVRGDQVDAAVAEAVLKAIGDQERRIRRWVPGEDHADVLAQVQQAIADLREEHDLGLYAGDRAGYLARLKGLTERRQVLAALPSRAGGWEAVGTGETYGQAWDRLGEDERRELLLSAGVRALAGKVGDSATNSIMILLPDDIVQRASGGRKGKRVEVMRVQLVDLDVTVNWYREWVGNWGRK